MAQFSLRIDDEMKNRADDICEELGIALFAAAKMLTKRLVRERRILFELSVDLSSTPSIIPPLIGGNRLD